MLLSEERLYESLQLLKPLAVKTSDFRHIDRLQSLEQNYNYLIQYFVSGANDPERDIIFHHLIAETFLLYDDISQILNQPSALLLQMQAKAADYVPEDEKYSLLKKRFYATWLRNEQSLPEPVLSEEKQMYVSALTIRLQQHFSEKDFLRLCQLASEYSDDEQQRAIVGLVILSHQYCYRLKFFPKIKDQIQALCKNDTISKSVLLTCKYLLQTSLTPLVCKEMDSLSRDIMPEIEKNPDKVFLTIEESDEGNPKWGQGNDSFNKHIDEMARLHSLGADINYSSTRGILTNPFFHNDIANWFLPFGKDNPEIGIDFESDGGKLMKGILLSNIEACDVDRYAMCTIYQQIQQQLSGKNMPSVISDMSNFGDDEMHFSRIEGPDATLRYVRGLYRFFYHNPWKIENTIADITSVCQELPFQTVCSDTDIQSFADQCINLSLFDEALELLDEDTAVSLQKRGFVLQKLENYEEALQSFQKALLLDADPWTLRHTATCLRQLGKLQEAIIIYDQLLSDDPDNKQLLMLKAQCLMQEESYSDALQIFFKLEILFPDDFNIERGLAWCAFVTADEGNSNFKIAEQYFEKIAFSDAANNNDFINYAHMLLVSGHRTEAINMYKKCIRKKSDQRLVAHHINQDTNLLLRHGVSASTLKLIKETLFIE